MTTVLLVAPKYNYGHPSEGYSFEYNNFFEPLAMMGLDAFLFDFMGILNNRGRRRMNDELVDVVRNLSPAALIAVPHRDELAPETLRQISEDSSTQTISWFSDDHWRFETYTRHLAPCFNWSVTTDTNAVPKYAALGYTNVIKSQWASNPFMYHPIDTPLEYAVTFVGQPHGSRRNSVMALRTAGIDVRVWGKGWPNGRVSQQQMLRIFCASRINLNLTNASAPRTFTGRVMAAAWRAAGSERFTRAQRGLLFDGLARGERSLRWMLPREVWDPDTESFVDQIKGRNFEVPGCGGFLLTGSAHDLETYYLPDREVATFDRVKTMIERIRYYLAHEDRRASVAHAGYERTLREHTYVHRFTDILSRVGIYCRPVDDVLTAQVRPGNRTALE
jgi:spore maturation protein CgeB